jgi:hypothetical protein
MRQIAAVASREIHNLFRLWAGTRMRQARIAYPDRPDMHMPARAAKWWQAGSREFQQEPDANSSCPPENEVALESCIAALALRRKIGAFFPVLIWNWGHEGKCNCGACCRPSDSGLEIKR